VFVRDVSLAPGAQGAYTLASALGGTNAGLSYAGSRTPGCPGGGSASAPRVALSGDGQQVAFTVVGSSNLTTGPRGGTTTPPAQIAVRDLANQTTTLVSQTLGSVGGSPQPVPGGAAMTDDSAGVGPKAGTANADAGDSTASISLDGTTVAWLGINIPSQTSADPSTDAPVGHPNEYDEPLWRSLAGSASPIRRVTGGDDPLGPCPGGCAGPLDTHWASPSNPEIGHDQGPERGTLIAYDGFVGASRINASSLANATPQLSSNGQTVAFLSTQPATSADPVYLSSPPTNVSTNAYVVNMAAGLDRSQALTRITAWGSSNFDNFPLAGPIEALALSPEGDRLAFVTRRTAFPQSPPALITPALTEADFEQLYIADLGDGTLHLVSTGYDGQPANSYVASPAFSAGDGAIAFASSATNLVYGALSDISGGYETFVATEIKPPAIPGQQVISPAPTALRFVPAWTLGATTASGRGGGVLLHVTVPGAGTLRAVAKTGRASGNLTLAHATARVRKAGLVSVKLSPAGRYHRLIARAGGLYATITLTFQAPGRARLTRRLPVDFAPAGRGSSHRGHR
jgi:hypothetical protein